MTAPVCSETRHTPEHPALRPAKWSNESPLVLKSWVHIARTSCHLCAVLWCSNNASRLHPGSWSTLDQEMFLMWEVQIPLQSKFQDVPDCSWPENALLLPAVQQALLHGFSSDENSPRSVPQYLLLFCLQNYTTSCSTFLPSCIKK